MVFDFFNREKQLKDNDFNDKIDIDWPDHVITLDEKSFDDFIGKYPLCIVDFWAPWCDPCKTMLPRFRRVASIYKRKAAFGRIDIQDNKSSSKKFGVSAIPHLIIFKNGKKISGSTGLKTVGDLKDLIDDLLKKN